jgi:D-sedoheptulose 7-phosphate isomerase
MIESGQKFIYEYLKDINLALDDIIIGDIQNMADRLSDLSFTGGRLFFIGNGGSVATGAHATNDFRKIANIEAYNIADGISELSARTNDEGFDTIFVEWLKTSNFSHKDAIFVLSVGGGDKDKNISMNIVKAIDYVNLIGGTIYGIVGKNGGYTSQEGDYVIIVPTIDKDLITPIVESVHSVLLHLLVSHPSLKQNQTKWESVK